MRYFFMQPTLYSEEDLKLMSGNQLHPEYYAKSLLAINGLVGLFSKEWVEKELVDSCYVDLELIKLLGTDRDYKGIIDLQRLIFLWEDLEVLEELPGFSKFRDLLIWWYGTKEFKNIDLEISVAADIVRLKAEVKLEPLVDSGPKKADCKFKLIWDDAWVYCEITRRMPATKRRMPATVKVSIDREGMALAKLVSAINPERKCVLVVKPELNITDYGKLTAWLKSKPAEGEFENKALFFSVPHNSCEREEALKYCNTPVSFRQGVFDISTSAFGVVYLHISDDGAKEKQEKKKLQLPKNEQGILFIDLTSIAWGIRDWTTDIVFSEEYKHWSAVVLIRDWNTSDGYLREYWLIENPDSINVLSVKTKEFLEKLFLMRKGKNLMTENGNL